jgi:hypothetical protein
VTEEIDLETRLAAAITDPDFEKLELAMREPDIFRALAIERQEIRHSNFFAFLLDPGENHGLGDILLRKFLRDIFADSRAQGRTLFDADLMDSQSGGCSAGMERYGYARSPAASSWVCTYLP